MTTLSTIRARLPLFRNHCSDVRTYDQTRIATTSMIEGSLQNRASLPLIERMDQGRIVASRQIPEEQPHRVRWCTATCLGRAGVRHRVCDDLFVPKLNITHSWCLRAPACSK